MCMDMRVDMCGDICTGMCIGMCMGTHRHVYRHVCRHVATWFAEAGPDPMWAVPHIVPRLLALASGRTQ